MVHLGGTWWDSTKLPQQLTRLWLRDMFKKKPRIQLKVHLKKLQSLMSVYHILMCLSLTTLPNCKRFALPASASPLLAGFEVYTVLQFALK